MPTYEYPKADVTSSVIPFTMNMSEDELAIIGIIRGKDPFKGEIALPGGFLNPGQETLRQCGFRETFLEEIIAIGDNGPMSDRLLVSIYDDFLLPRPTEADLKLVCEQSDPHRDPRFEKTGAPVIDHVYSIRLPYEIFNYKLTGGDDAVGLIRIAYQRDDLPTIEAIQKQWAFDHGNSICHFLVQIGWLNHLKLSPVAACPACGKV